MLLLIFLASNFLRAFGNIPQVVALGLVQDHVNSGSTAPGAVQVKRLGILIQSFARFIFEQFEAEMQGSGIIRDGFAINLRLESKCASVGHVYNRDSSPFTIELPAGKTGDFVDTIIAGICKTSTNKAWCEGCSAYVLQTQSTSVVEMPSCLNLNAGWSELWADGRETHQIPEILRFMFEASGLRRAEAEEVQGVCEYELTGVVFEICHEEDTAPHLVSVIKKGEEWVCFNDFLVQVLPDDEALQVTSWKVSLIFLYMRSRSLHSSTIKEGTLRLMRMLWH